MSLTVLPLGTALADLPELGSIKDLGGEVFEGGDVRFHGKGTYGAPTDAINAGYFGTTKGRYRLVYPFSEQATLLSGEVRITDESTGQATLFKAGDSWFITKGTSTLWEVISDGYAKHYLSFN